MKSTEILEVYRSLQGDPHPVLAPLLQLSQTRPKSFSIEDTTFGDSGKGSVVAKINHLLAQKSPVVSVRYNGGANAGHETYINGEPIVTHQLPTGVIQEGVTAVISRGMVIHPEDLLTEIEQVSRRFGDKLPGTLTIDKYTPLALDTHRALETTFNTCNSGGKGSTGRGIATAYASYYQRHPVLIDDLMDNEWESILRSHYRFYNKQISGLGRIMVDIPVATVAEEKKTKTVGHESEFIRRLGECREQLRPYINKNTYSFLQESWNNPKVAFTLEGAQGPGLDPYHGVYPDVTASRPMSRNINDATYNIILPEEIGFRLAVTKTTYMSSVGQRRLPAITDTDQEKWIQAEFAETGRSTGRLRDIYPISLPIATYLKRGAGYHALVATHLDAARENQPIRVTTHYTRAFGEEEAPYLPYQKELNALMPHNIEFAGWDGQAVKGAASLEDLPLGTKRYLAFLSQTIAPIAMLTTGPNLEEYILLTSL